ncbi:MAG TPA: response regulator, partial [Geothrix sp.]|nr:response regulator [Geothrix sp.]
PGQPVPAPAEHGTPPSLVGCRILVVEDDAVLSDVLVELFTLRGARVTVAVDGAEGWRKLREAAFDLVVCDQQMPHMTGMELLAELRKVDRELPVVLVSGHGLEGMDEGRDPRTRALAKPFGIDRLLDLIADVL